MLVQSVPIQFSQNIYQCLAYPSLDCRSQSQLNMVPALTYNRKFQDFSRTPRTFFPRLCHCANMLFKIQI